MFAKYSNVFGLLRCLNRSTHLSGMGMSTKIDPLGDLNQLATDSVPTVIQEEVIDEANENEIEMKRNKSRLSSNHYNMIHERRPYQEAESWIHNTLRYQRRIYGRYGSASGVNPVICWPTDKELQEKNEYESVAYDYTIEDIVTKNKNDRELKRAEIDKRQADIVKKMAKLGQWKKELADRIAKKEQATLAAKAKKDRLVEEVRRHFGFKVDPKDERFKEMLEQKEKQQKKLEKEAKRQAKEARYLATLVEQAAGSNTTEKK